MVLINGVNTQQWFVADRAFLYGDGCFTTMLAKFGQIQHWQTHLARLKRDTAFLSIASIDWQQLHSNLLLTTDAIQHEARAVVKILISRGIGGQGYSPTHCDSPTVIISTHRYPAHYLVWQKQGINLAVLKQRIGISPLAGIKHLNRLEQVLLKRELAQLNVQDAVVCCINGDVVETTSGNIFWRKGRTIYTPDLSMAGVLGTQRAIIINTLGGLNCQVEEVNVGTKTLLSADEIFVCNALMEVVPVRKIENTLLKNDSFCKELMLRLKQ